MKKYYFLQWLFFSILGIVFGIIAYHFWIEKLFFSTFLFASFSCVLMGYCYVLISAKIKETEKIITSILQKDFSLFPKKEHFDDLKNASVKLYYQSKEEHNQLYSYKNLYDTILNKLEIGLIILSKNKEEKNWQVFYCNPSFMNILKIPKYNNWSFYESKIPEFYNLIEKTSYQDSQDFIDVSIQESSKQSYSIRTSRITTQHNDFCVISLESIQKIIDKKEKLAWNNLMKVISHELLNTLTPVNSLVHNLEYITEQEELTKEDQDDIKDSLKIINSKSQQLLHFIDSYRQVAELPKPKKTHFNLKNCVENVLKIFNTEFKNKNIEIVLNLKDFHIKADEKMIERVLVNLITNSIFALENLHTQKKISIELQDFNNRTLIKVEDNGGGIDEKIANKIFLPFFTTRQNGSGIGLTLAKSIMEAHNGYLTYRKTENGSSFEGWLI